MKKAAISIQFNWLFVLIAGAVILLFFFSIVQWQKKSSESKIDVAVLTNLDAILTGVRTTEYSTNVVTIPKSEISFDCDNYYIGSTKKPIKGSIIFAPGLISGTKILTQTLSWSMPFKIANFLYLTSPQIRYILVYDPALTPSKNLLTDINKSLPTKYMLIQGQTEIAMNKEIWNKSYVKNVQDENNYKVKFIFFNTGYTNLALTNLQRMPDKDVTAIEVNEPNTINFYQKGGPSFIYTGTSYYLGKEALIGAIFSENSEMFNCSIQKGFAQLEITSQIYRNRSYDLMNYYLGLNPPDTRCGVFDHKNAALKLDTISKRSAFISQAVNVQNEMTGLVGDISELQSYNNNANLHSCVLVY